MSEFGAEGMTYGTKSIENLDGWKIDPMGRGKCPYSDT